MRINFKSKWSFQRLFFTVTGFVIFCFSCIRLDILTSFIGLFLFLIGFSGIGTASKKCCESNCNPKNKL